MPDHARGPVLDRRLLLQLGAAAGALAACTPAPSAPEPSRSSAATTWQPPVEPMVFPAGFVWGAATSAFQIEGSTTADGRGRSIWDTFAARPGRVVDGATGDPAADHYRRWESDLDLLADLGLPAYRFSVAWPRIQPTGSGPANQRGLDFYRRLVDGLHVRGIHPAITLYHWDLPQVLQDGGGWAARATADRFAEYAAIVFDALRDADATWLTLNEPKTTAYVGHRWGGHAPGISDVDQAAAAVHHQLLAHGKAVQAFRASGAAGDIGIALNLLPVYPVDRGADTAAVHLDAVENRLFLDPVLLGRYPTDALGTRAGQLPADVATFEGLVHDGDLGVISSPLDVLAVQYYGVTGVDDAGNQVELYPTSAAVWQQVHAEGLYDLLMDLLVDYPDAPPLVITENGIPDPTSDGTLDDTGRIEFLRAHLQQAARAIGDGARLTGYYAWSLLDNFEWAEGLSQRWGLVHVDFDTQARTPKASADWYAAVVDAHAVTPD